MNYFDSKPQKRKLYLDNPKDLSIVEKEIYKEYLRKANDESDETIYVDSEHLENIFTNEIYYRAMNEVTPEEKALLYYTLFEYRSLNEVCKEMKKSKAEIICLKSKAIEHFKNNVEKYREILSSTEGGDVNV